ncbi:GMP/IMP nucleotidase YrfG [hydrothermal vent metagenome]|uniref:GMP/IMP nucleotidase YrfG n=1 Tax=hydrothermal vent metagenome TaxID=652676 RepID=A0A3B0X414_9ZZZZ
MNIDVDSKKISNKILPWENIETVLLDMDGTLLDLHFDNHFWLSHVPKCYAEKHGLTQDEAHKTLMQRYGEVRGSLNWYCVDFWTKELSLDIEKLKHDTAEKISIRAEVVNFLFWLNANNKRVVLVTNAHQASLNLKMDKTNLHVYFDEIINAHDIGLAKEHAGFWEKLQAVEPYSKQRTLLIDDNLEVLDSAYEYGIEHCLGILQPDSQGEAIYSEKFTVIDDFKEIFS